MQNRNVEKMDEDSSTELMPLSPGKYIFRGTLNVNNNLCTALLYNT